MTIFDGLDSNDEIFMRCVDRHADRDGLVRFKQFTISRWWGIVGLNFGHVIPSGDQMVGVSLDDDVVRIFVRGIVDEVIVFVNCPCRVWYSGILNTIRCHGMLAWYRLSVKTLVHTHALAKIEIRSNRLMALMKSPLGSAMTSSSGRRSRFRPCSSISPSSSSNRSQ